MIIIINNQPLVCNYILYMLIFVSFKFTWFDIYMSTEVFLTCS